MTDQGIERGLTDYGDRGFSRYLRRAFAKSMGYSDEDLAKPIVGIANTYSEFNNCHRGLKELAEAVKRGVWQAGGLPLEFPTISLGEPFLHPTSMLFRNLMAMDTEEMIRAQPIDCVVLMGGCDKTTPAQLMAAASAGVPAIVLVAGPMMTGAFGPERLGACTDCRRFWGEYRGGRIDDATIRRIEGSLATTQGTCMVMGTASTMACLTETLGMMLPGGAAIPAVHADRLRQAEQTGRTAVEMIAAGRTPDQIMTPPAFENACRVLLAIGGSTNAVIHLTAMAGRMGVAIEPGFFDRLSEETPVLVNLKPTGIYYMEDFHNAGGLETVLQELRPKLNLDCLSVTGRTLGERLDDRWNFPDWQDVIAPAAKPLQEKGGLVVLRGNLCPDGAVLKRSAASADLMQHEGRAVVFDGLEDLAQRIDDPALDVAPEDVLVLKNAGPKGAPGMPEAGYLPIPQKLARQGIKDMVRISDARMSGTAFGTIVLHIAPEASVGGLLGLVETGDRVVLDVDRRRLELMVDEEELHRRRAGKGSGSPRAAASLPARGYLKLHMEQVEQANLGCDLAFLRPASKTTLA
ncbi:MAG: dihydroxy-acid dehydratase [SAR324 cluster bacterium]|nr:dihydroxy-acid dehydratase [SAR324 cluster bacterium]